MCLLPMGADAVTLADFDGINLSDPGRTVIPGLATVPQGAAACGGIGGGVGASGQMLCGSDLDLAPAVAQGANRLAFQVDDFASATILRFAFAVEATGDGFERSTGVVDFLRVVANSSPTPGPDMLPDPDQQLLIEYRGITATDQFSVFDNQTTSVVPGIIENEFQIVEVDLTTLAVPLAGPGTIEFLLRSSFGDEFLALDQIELDLEVVPIPATLPLVLTGVGALWLARRRRRVT